MYVVRPVDRADIGALEAMAAISMPGVHTLPRTREGIVAAVERSLASFAAQVDIPSEESYLFVLEDLRSREVVGTAIIHASAGSNGTYFAFRNDVIQQVSRDLNISHSVHALTLCSELTAYSQLSGFFLRHRDSAGIEAALLSRARLLYAMLAPHRFGDRFFVPLAGRLDADGQSPFWNALGRKFFKMDFLEAERLIEGARNRTLIVELMPHYPVYVPLLPGDAQAALGQIHPGGQIAFDLLAQEGFEADEYIDIFDGGPILQAHKNALRSFCASYKLRVGAGPAQGTDHAPDVAPVDYAVASVDNGFRAVTVRCAPIEHAHSIDLPREVQQALGVSAGDEVVCVRIQGEPACS
ncbi:MULTISPECIES: arginine N-succinyltransferase [Massilia]|uniref:Arginine N-succinyltransferase n=1 Tax=Massilia aurea TaxID=373040 RepID=A0A422QR51_9BURK|nr:MULTISPECIES: arginine N-succinyltransferase [Massilia]MDY0961853.1 arginine N-succinyltransferase [Massilia sp. CFBP9026]RNF32497.1 arginine N-succinyltransferase [Massilia aurea]